jgi:coronin-1B/1C/6
MSGRFVRASSYRHVHGVPAKPDESFMDLRPQTTGDGNYVCGNDKFVAFASQGGGGPLVVHDMSVTGRMNNMAPKITVHKAKVLDFQFSPFMSNMIASGGEDCYAKVTVFPEDGLKEDIKEATVVLEGHQKKVNIIKYNPTAKNILATASFDHLVKLWDVEAQAEVLNFDAHEEVPAHLDWNGNGSQLVSTCKDHKMRIFDPRQKEAAMTTAGFEGSKKSTALWMDNHGLIASIGFTKNSARQYSVHDPKKFDTPLATADIDQSAGVLMCTYDPDTSVLFIGGKGDGSIKYFEVVNEAPYIHFLSEFRNSQSQKGLGWLPKYACDTSKCEIARALRLMRDCIQPVSFQVPRKSDLFQADIFPDTYAGVPSNNSADWLGGKDADPVMRSMKPGTEVNKDSGFTAKKSPKEMQAELDVANKRIAELEKELAALKP